MLRVQLIFVPMLDCLQLSSMMFFDGAADVVDHGLVVLHKHELGPVGTKHKQIRCQVRMQQTSNKRTSRENKKGTGGRTHHLQR